MVIPEFLRGLPRRAYGTPRNDSVGGVAQENPGHGHPRIPEGIATSCLPALLAMTTGDVAQGNPGHGYPRIPEGIATSCLPALLAMTAGRNGQNKAILNRCRGNPPWLPLVPPACGRYRGLNRGPAVW